MVEQLPVDLQLQQLPQGAHQQILQMTLLMFQPHHQSQASLQVYRDIWSSSHILLDTLKYWTFWIPILIPNQETLLWKFCLVYVLDSFFYFNAWMNAGAGSKTVPLTDGSSSDGGIMDSPLHFVVLLFITSCVSTFTGFWAFCRVLGLAIGIENGIFLYWNNADLC